MGRMVTGALGGLLAGVMVDEVIRAGRRNGFINYTSVEQQEQALGRALAIDRRLGPATAKRYAHTNWLTATTVAGALYGVLQRRRHPAHPLLAGGVYGLMLYAGRYMRPASRPGVAREAAPELPAVVVERVGLHALFGMMVAVIAGGLSPRPLAPRPLPPRSLAPPQYQRDARDAYRRIRG